MKKHLTTCVVYLRHKRITEYYEQLYDNKLQNLDKMGNFYTNFIFQEET